MVGLRSHMRIGLELPPLAWPEAGAWVRRAEDLGFESLWVGDRGEGGRGASDPLPILGALARLTSRPRLGTLALCAARRPPTVLAKALATADVASGGRLVVGLGAGEGPEDVERLAETCQVLDGMFGGGPFSFTGRHWRAVEARCLPRPLQRPRPPMWLRGGSDGLLEVVARHAEGWSPMGPCTAGAYRERWAALDEACRRAGRDPGTVTRSVSLDVLVGDSPADVARRFDRLWRAGPAAVAGATTLGGWRAGRLVGTPAEVAAALQEWAAVGVDTLMLAPAGARSGAAGAHDMDMLAAACSLGGR